MCNDRRVEMILRRLNTIDDWMENRGKDYHQSIEKIILQLLDSPIATYDEFLEKNQSSKGGYTSLLLDAFAQIPQNCTEMYKVVFVHIVPMITTLDEILGEEGNDLSSGDRELVQEIALSLLLEGSGVDNLHRLTSCLSPRQEYLFLLVYKIIYERVQAYFKANLGLEKRYEEIPERNFDQESPIGFIPRKKPENNKRIGFCIDD